MSVFRSFRELNTENIHGCFLTWGYPLSSSILDWDVHGFPIFVFLPSIFRYPDRLGNPQITIKFKGPQRRPARALKSTVGTHPATASSCTTTREMTQNSGWVNNKKQIPQAILVYKKSHVRFSHNMRKIPTNLDCIQIFATHVSSVEKPSLLSKVSHTAAHIHLASDVFL